MFSLPLFVSSKVKLSWILYAESWMSDCFFSWNRPKSIMPCVHEIHQINWLNSIRLSYIGIIFVSFNAKMTSFIIQLIIQSIQLDKKHEFFEQIFAIRLVVRRHTEQKTEWITDRWICTIRHGFLYLDLLSMLKALQG